MKILNRLMVCALTCICLVSCDKSREVQKAAIDQLHVTIRAMVENPNNIALENGKTVYKDDSLCIIHFTLNDSTYKDNVSMIPMEYVYLLHDGQAYEGIQQKKDYQIYIPEDKFDAERQNTAYHYLTYKEAVRYKAAVFVNGRGKMVGDSSEMKEFNIPVPTKTGNWEIHDYKEINGSTSGSHFIMLLSKGFYSKPTSGSHNLMAIITHEDGRDINIKLVEDNYRTVRNLNFYDCTVKDAVGEEHKFVLRNCYYGKMGIMSTDSIDGNQAFDELLIGGGELEFTIQGRDNMSRDKYRFKANIDGYTEAKSFL